MKYASDNNWRRKNDIRRGSNEDMNQDPSFAYLSETNIQANIGSTITFNCRVLNAKHHTVSKSIKAVDVYLILIYYWIVPINTHLIYSHQYTHSGIVGAI